MFFNLKRISYAAVFLAAILLPLLSCSSAGEKPRFSCLRFAVLNNSAPESPFNGWPDTLKDVAEDISKNSVDFVVLNGNAVFGGESRTGIDSSDLKRQYSLLLSDFEKLNAPFYFAAGSRGLFNKGYSVYTDFFEQGPFYSFNCGSVHCVVLSYSSGKKEVMNWLKNDLSLYRNSGGIIVFKSESPFSRRGNGSLSGHDLEMHNLFRKYNVRIVISGEAEFFLEKDHEGIKYINAGCGGFHDRRYYRKFSHYYLFRVDDKTCKVEPVQIK